VCNGTGHFFEEQARAELAFPHGKENPEPQRFGKEESQVMSRLSRARTGRKLGRKLVSLTRSHGRLALAVTTTLGAFWVSHKAEGQAIGLSFTGGQGTNGVSILDDGDFAGAPGFVQQHWNNLNTNTDGTGTGAYTNGPNPLLDSSNGNRTMSLWWGSPNTWSISTAVPTTPNGKLMNGYIDSNAAGTGTNGTDLNAAANQPYVAVMNIPSDFLVRGYKVVVYADGDSNARSAQYWLQSFDGNLNTNRVDLTPHFFVGDTANFGGTFTQATSTNAATVGAGNYMVFGGFTGTGLTSASFVLRADELNTRAPINAIQIVANPSAATDYIWNVTGGGSWNTNTNWQNSLVPNDFNAMAKFLGAINTNAIVTIDSSSTVRGLQFDKTGASYDIQGPGNLILETPFGFGAPAPVQVLNGNHTIEAGIILNADAGFDVAAGATLNVINSGIIASGPAGATGIVKTGAGLLVLGGSGGYSGPTRVDAGTVRLVTSNALPTTTSLSSSGATGGLLDLNGNSIQVLNLVNGVNITSSSAATLTIGGVGDATHNGTIGGNITIVKLGANIQGLSGANTFTGTFTINEGTVRILSGNSVLGSTSAPTIIDGNTANLALWNNTAGNEPIIFGGNGGQISDRGTMNGSITLGSGLNNFNANSGVAEPIRANGVVSGAGQLTKTGVQDLVLNNVNTYTGGTELQQGGIVVGSSSVGGTGTNGPLGTGDLHVVGGGAHRLAAVNGNQTVSNNVLLDGPVTFAASGTNTLTLAGTVTLNTNGPIAIGADANTTGIISGKLTGNIGLSKTGAGTVVLTNTTNDFGGGINLVQGKLSINDLAQLGQSQSISFQNGLLQVTGTAINNMGARNADVDWGNFSGGFDIADPANTFTVGSSIGSGGFFQKDGAGKLILAVDNTYTGGTIVNGGVLQMNTSNGILNDTALTVNGGLLDLRGSSKQFTSLNGTGGVIGNTTASPITLTVGSNDANGSWSGSLQNGSATTSLTKIGIGTLTLGGANTYTGPTTVSAGTLAINGSLANTAVTVQSGATLGGAGGTISGSVTVQNNATVAPTGRLTFGSLNLQAGSKLNISLFEPGRNGFIDVLNSGGLTANGGAVTVAPGIPFALIPAGTSYPILKYVGTLGGSISNITLTNPQVGDITLTATNVTTTSGGSVNLTVGTVLQTWTGATDGNWDTTSANWSGAGTNYVNAKPVRFDDTGNNTTITAAAGLTPSRIDFANTLKDYTFSGSVGSAGTLTKNGAGKAIFNDPMTQSGPVVVNGGVIQLQGSGTLSSASGIALGATGPRPGDTAGPLASARGGTLYFVDNTVSNRTGSVPITMTGGTLVVAKGATPGVGLVTVPTVNANTGMSRMIVAPNGDTYILNVTSLNMGPTASMDFRAATGTLGDEIGGQIKLGNFSEANLNLGLLGPRFTVGTNFASYNNNVGVVPNATNLQSDITLVNGSSNYLNNGTNAPTGTNAAVYNSTSLVANSIISNTDITVTSGASITINSGGLIMSGANKWFQSSNNANPATVTTGPGVQDMVFTVQDTGTDHRLRWRVIDNGSAVNFIKNGDGYLRLNEANTYTGQTIVNAGILGLGTQEGSLGTDTSKPIIVREGAALDVSNQRVGWREVQIIGAGPTTGAASNGATLGAVINLGTPPGASADGTNAVRRLTLLGDATIGGSARWDVRSGAATAQAVLEGGTFTLTKVGANQISIVTPDHVNIGNIVVNAGTLGFESKDNIMGDTNFTATMNTGGTLFLWNNLGAGMTQSKPMVLNGGRITSGGDAATRVNNVNGVVRLNPVASNQLQVDVVMNVNGVMFGSGGFEKVGTAPLTLTAANTYSGTTLISRGSLTVTGSIPNSPVIVGNQGTAGGGTLLVPVNLSIPSLEVRDFSQTTISSTGTVRTTLKTGALSFTGSGGTATGQININNNALVVDTAPGGEAAALAVVKDAVIRGFNATTPGAGDGNWLGKGITSTNAQGANATSQGVGYALSSEVLGASGGTFLQGPVDGSAVVVRETLLGDATLNGVVDFNDLVQLAQNYNVVDGTRTWFTGDFTYDGNTNFNDLVKLAQNYNTALPSEAIPGASAQFEADLAAAFASVPEPGALSLLGLAACGLAARRRRRERPRC
jgi:autotransporter-associated beta strand protein